MLSQPSLSQLSKLVNSSYEYLQYDCSLHPEVPIGSLFQTTYPVIYDGFFRSDVTRHAMTLFYDTTRYM